MKYNMSIHFWKSQEKGPIGHYGSIQAGNAELKLTENKVICGIWICNKDDKEKDFSLKWKEYYNYSKQA